jgi:hypothetical protein
MYDKEQIITQLNNISKSLEKVISAYNISPQKNNELDNNNLKKITELKKEIEAITFEFSNTSHETISKQLQNCQNQLAKITEFMPVATSRQEIKIDTANFTSGVIQTMYNKQKVETKEKRETIIANLQTAVETLDSLTQAVRISKDVQNSSKVKM